MTGHRVAITGLGAISALGSDVASLWAGACAGRCGIGAIAGIATERLGVRIAAEASGFDPAAHFGDRELPMLDRTAQMALVAAREAMRAAGLDSAPARAARLPDAGRGGVVLGAAIGLGTFDASYKAVYGDGANRVHPFTVPRIMPNAATSHLSMAFGLRGPSFSAASACASSNHAIGQAFHMVRGGMLDLALTGGTDASITFGFMKGWEALRVLSPDGCRPFSADRNGLVIGEGAAILVLERWDQAVARGAAILGELAGFGMSADAGDIIAPSAEGAVAAMRMALADAALAPEQIGTVNAHGTGTRLNDKTETAALRRLFGRLLDRIPVSASKSMLGHCMTAGGALEAVLTVLALRHRMLPPTLGYAGADPDCDLDCVPNQARACAPEAAISNAFAFGGLNAVLAFRAVA